MPRCRFNPQKSSFLQSGTLHRFTFNYAVIRLYGQSRMQPVFPITTAASTGNVCARPDWYVQVICYSGLFRAEITLVGHQHPSGRFSRSQLSYASYAAKPIPNGIEKWPRPSSEGYGRVSYSTGITKALNWAETYEEYSTVVQRLKKRSLRVHFSFILISSHSKNNIDLWEEDKNGHH